jgi:hypothetical protein
MANYSGDSRRLIGRFFKRYSGEGAVTHPLADEPLEEMHKRRARNNWAVCDHSLRVAPPEHVT